MFSFLKNFKYLLIFVFIACSFKVEASVSNGTIDPIYHNALLCRDSLCSTTTIINFKTILGSIVNISDTKITGNAWSETFGWVNFSPTYGGVTNTINGIVGGYAWGSESGWINFAPSKGGVTINNNGQFVGYAWSENYGWIRFDCTVLNACVSTDWRPVGARNTSPGGGGSASSGGSSSGGGSFYIPPTPPVTITTPEINLIIKPVKKGIHVVRKIKTIIRKEDVFVNPEPLEQPQIFNPSKEPAKKLISSLSKTTNISTSTKNSFWNNILNFLKMLWNFIKDNIISSYFLGFSLSFSILGFIGYINPFWIFVFLIFIFWLVIFIYKKKHREVTPIEEG